MSDNDIHFCLICSRLFLLGNQLKPGIFNGLPCMDCQLYLPALADLSIAKEAAMVYAYPVISILKLRPSGAFSLVAYSCIKSYTVFFL